MSATADPIVIVGAGQAGARAALALRDAGYGGALVMIGSELHPPYERPPLSKALLCQPAEPVTPVLTDEQHARCGIELLLGAQVARLDCAGRRVHLADGRALAYANCLLATGGEARVHSALPPGAPRVHYLRSLDDARRLRAALAAGARLAVVGAGFLGLEAAASAAALGAQVTVLEAAPALLGRFVPAEVSGWLAESLRQRGIALRLGCPIEQAACEADGVRLQLADGSRVEADHALVAIGLTPHVALARAAGLDIDPHNGGIAVDAACRTSDAHVFAAGDCASQFNPHLGQRLRIESWQNANEQARVAAAGLLGLPTPAMPYPWFWTDQGEHNLQMLGLGAPGLAYARRGDPAGGKALWIGLRDGVPVHGIALNAGGDLRALRPLFEDAVPVDGAGFSTAPGPLRAWVKAAQAAAAAAAPGAPPPSLSLH